MKNLSMVYVLLLGLPWAVAEMKTWDGKHAIDDIEVTVVYFVPQDRKPLVDWRERVDYYTRRIEKFHQREYGGQSSLATKVIPEPFISEQSTEKLRIGDGNAIFYKTLREVDARLKFGPEKSKKFPILLVLSEINWRPLDDFYRVAPKGDRFEFEGNYNRGRHFPGAKSGGARAIYNPHQGVGWGLVSADGWRVPYRGSDCVIYHEGVGHTVGLPHPKPGNGSVMSLGQYRGWISESWLDDVQKERLGWKKPEMKIDRKKDLFSAFQALPEPTEPKPGGSVGLKLRWPEGAEIESCRVRIQTDVHGPWLDLPVVDFDEVGLGRFDRPTPVSYRVDAKLKNGSTEELWGYFQVRSHPNVIPLPPRPARMTKTVAEEWQTGEKEIDLLGLINLKVKAGPKDWTLKEGVLESPKAYGARIETRYQPPEAYRLTAVVEPLDEPHGLLFGQRMGANRFMVLTHYKFAPDRPSASALENVDGLNVNRNATTKHGDLYRKNRLSQVVCTVRNGSVKVQVDGQTIMDWKGRPDRLSLSDYWQTPNKTVLMLGAYNCRYRFHRLSLTPLSGTGEILGER